VSVKIIGQKEDGKIDLSIKQAEPGYEDRPRRSGKDPDFERKLKKFMSQSQERLVDLKRHKEGKR
jgi:S1 RNA binding domain protein